MSANKHTAAAGNPSFLVVSPPNGGWTGFWQLCYFVLRIPRDNGLVVRSADKWSIEVPLEHEAIHQELSSHFLKHVGICVKNRDQEIAFLAKPLESFKTRLVNIGEYTAGKKIPAGLFRLLAL